MTRLLSFLRPPRPEKFNAETLETAQAELVQHQAAAEYHATMASFYEQRIARLSAPTIQ